MTFAVMAEASANTWTNGWGSICGITGAGAFGTHIPCLFFRVPRGHRFGLGASDDIYLCIQQHVEKLRQSLYV